MANRYKRTSRSARARREAQRRKMIKIAGAAVAAVLVLTIAITGLMGRKRSDPVTTAPAAQPTQEVVATAEPVTPPEPTAEPTPAPQVEVQTLAQTQTAAPVVNAARAATRPTAADEGHLPVFKKADTDEKIIAITVDDCFQAGNLRQIIDIAIENGGKLTFFPIGKNVLKKEVGENLKYAYENGFELENHTYSHSGLYKGSDAALAKEIYMEQMVLTNLLGVEYQCHFLRPMGGDARDDQRIHEYARQMGYYGIAHWVENGADVTASRLAKATKPGAILLFHTTDHDLEVLREYIPWVVSKGYQLVTLNELFGYPANETSPLQEPAPKERVAPTLAPYPTVYARLKADTYSHQAYDLQAKLIELGYMTGEPDGVYGKGNAEVIKKYQKDHGLEETGICEPELLKSILES